MKTDSSDSSLRSESSSSPRADDGSSEKIVTAVQTLLPPDDAADVIREHRFLLRKAKGKPDLVLDAVDHARQHRSRVRRIVPYVITLIDSLVAGVPLFPVAKPTFQLPPPPDPPRNVVRASKGKQKWHNEYLERKQRLHSPPMAASF